MSRTGRQPEGNNLGLQGNKKLSDTGKPSAAKPAEVMASGKGSSAAMSHKSIISGSGKAKVGSRKVSRRRTSTRKTR